MSPDGAGCPAPTVPLLDRPRVRVALGLLGIVLALAVWELLVATGVLPRQDVSPASDVLVRLAEIGQTAAFWNDVSRTAQGALLGLGVAVVVGVSIGMAMGLSTPIYHALNPTVEFLRPVPAVALIPLAILLWGQSLTTVWTLVAFSCVWPLLVQSYYGAGSLDETARDTARALRLSRWTLVRSVLLPGALPYIVTGLRISASIALIAAVGAELLTGALGLGEAILRAQEAGRFDDMYALIVATGVLGVAIQMSFGQAESRFLKWHPSQQEGVR